MVNATFTPQIMAIETSLIDSPQYLGSEETVSLQGCCCHALVQGRQQRSSLLTGELGGLVSALHMQVGTLSSVFVFRDLLLIAGDLLIVNGMSSGSCLSVDPSCVYPGSF